MIALCAAGLALATWVYMLLFRGDFWLARERDDVNEPSADPAAWPSVTAVVPARDEADVVVRSVGSLLAQDYPGAFRVILVDDNSSDGTADAARAAAGSRHTLEILTGAPLVAGWTGKLWAVRQGVEAAGGAPDYLLLTDADIAHDVGNLQALVRRAEAGGLVLTSLMARLCTQTWAERMLIPAFVLFFQMLYPFALVNRGKAAAAAGGCMLVRREALAAAGGIESIRTAIIDDCALAARMATQGPIWLGLTQRAVSLRPYARFGDIGAMVSRSAYAQLNFSPWLLAGTVMGMALVYLTGPLAAVFGDGWSRWLGLGAWAAMIIAFQPMLRYYRASPLWGVALPLIGLIYTAFTVASALQFAAGRGGQWKGRAQAIAGSS